MLEIFDYFHALPDRTPIEQALFDITQKSWKAAGVVRLLRERPTEMFPDWIVSMLKDERGPKTVTDLSLYAMPFIHARWGAEGVEDVVLAIEDADHRLFKAAELLGRAAQ